MIPNFSAIAMVPAIFGGVGIAGWYFRTLACPILGSDSLLKPLLSRGAHDPLPSFVQHMENEDTENRHPDSAGPEVVTELEEAGCPSAKRYLLLSGHCVAVLKDAENPGPFFVLTLL